jgi:Tfp pilus assembly protein PilF
MRFLVAALVLLAGCAHKTAVRRPSGYNVDRAIARHARVYQAELLSQGDLTGDNLRRAVALRPDDLEARRRLAAHYESNGQPELAVEHLRFASQRFPQDAALRASLARLLHRMDLDAEALDALGGITSPTAESESWRGILLDALGRHEDAFDAHRAAAALAPRDASLQNNIGQNLLLRGKPKDAAAHFRAALERDPRHEAARNNLGVALALTNPREAIAHWQSLAGPAAAHTNLAAVYLERDRLADARRELNAALGYDRNYQPALANLALVAERDGLPAVLEPGASRPSPTWAKIKSKLSDVFGR